MKNKLVFIVTLVIIAGIAAAVFYSRSIREHIDTTANARNETENAERHNRSTDGIGGMSISGMEIVQGEKGHELWRLIANGAVMSEEGGDIIAENPHLTYYMYNESGEKETLYVKSDTGDVNQKENRMRFIGNVVVTHNKDVLTTNLIIYDGSTNRLNCPEKSWIKSPGMEGEANTMFWHLDDNTLHANGGVNLNLDTKRAAFPTGQAK